MARRHLAGGVLAAASTTVSQWVMKRSPARDGLGSLQALHKTLEFEQELEERFGGQDAHHQV